MLKLITIFALFTVMLGAFTATDGFAADALSTTPTAAATSQAGTASVIVRNFYNTLTDAMKQGDQLGYAGRYKKLDPAVRQSFDLAAMTRFAVGPAWSKATPTEQQDLINAFSAFTIASYATQFSSYHDEEFTVVDEKTMTGGGVIVETTLKPKDKPAVALNYLLRTDDKGTYRIVDVYLNGSISQLAARRAEFNDIAQREGIPALVGTLDERSKKMGPT